MFIIPAAEGIQEKWKYPLYFAALFEEPCCQYTFCWNLYDKENLMLDPEHFTQINEELKSLW